MERLMERTGAWYGTSEEPLRSRRLGAEESILDSVSNHTAYVITSAPLCLGTAAAVSTWGSAG